MPFIKINKQSLEAMPADVAAFVKDAAQRCRVRKALYSTVIEKPQNMWADEGANIAVFYCGQRAQAQTASMDTIGGGDSLKIGRYTAPAGTWTVSQRIFMGKWGITIHHVLTADERPALLEQAIK